MDVMRSQPLSLALVLMNVLLMLLFYIILNSVSETRKREVQMFFDEDKQVRAEMLAEHKNVIDLLVKCGQKTKSLLRLPELPPIPIRVIN